MADHAGSLTGRRDVKWDIISGGRCRCQGRIGCLSSSVLLGQRRRLALSRAAAKKPGRIETRFKHRQTRVKQRLFVSDEEG